MTNLVDFYSNNGTVKQNSGIKKTQAGENKKTPVIPTTPIKDSLELSKKLTAAKNQNGLIEKAADFIKEKTGFGTSIKSIEQDINDGKKTGEEITQTIKNYRRSQENTMQAVADVATSAVSMGAFFKVKNLGEKWSTALYTMNKDTLNTMVEHGSNPEKAKKYFKLLEKKSTFIGLGAVAAALVGSQIKPLMLSLNRVGTKQYDADLTDLTGKGEIKKAKKEARNAKWGANFRNFFTGAIDGATVPILALLGPVGAPVYAAVNSLSRYFIAEKEDKGEKSVSSYVDNIANSKVGNALAGAAIIAAGVKYAKSNKTFEKNLKQAAENIENAFKSGTVKPLESNVSSYEKLENVLFNNPQINGIVENGKLTTAQKIQQLSDLNIFALKFKQIKMGYDPLTQALKTDCPPTRTVEEAQALISKTFGEQYQITDLAGVGTVAESYMAKDVKTGKEVCIKMLKNGITKEKIEADKTAFIDMIKNMKVVSRKDKDAEIQKIQKEAEEKLKNANLLDEWSIKNKRDKDIIKIESLPSSEKEKEFLIKNIENIAEGVIKEVDFVNEKKAAEELVKVTKKAKVVKPIEVKDNIYVMEKADGICLHKLLNELRNPESSIKLTESDGTKLMKLYQDVLVEQFTKVDKTGKIVHGDIHPGNIFIDIDALKAGKKDCLTLIDTGNTITQDPKNAIRFMKLTSYINNADVDNIVKFVLEGAQLPKGLTKEEAEKKLTAEFKELFFSTKTSLPPVNNDNILKISENLMRKYDIVPADTQGNLMKAKTSAGISLMNFYETLFKTMLGGNEEKNLTITQSIKLMSNLMLEKMRYSLKKSIQENKNNMLLSPAERMKLKNSENTPDENSLEYLTYALKQYKTDNIDANNIGKYIEKFFKDMFSV